MDFLKKNRTAIGGLVAIALVLYIYITHFAPQSGDLTAAGPDSGVGSDLLVTLGSLHTIRLDESIFKRPDFTSLSDFGVSIPPQDSGRRNPFAPVGK
jgi:hypothetical protein